MIPYLPLALAILGLLVGPALYAIPHWRSWDRILDSFTVAAVGGLCLFHLLPEALEHGGWLALLAAGVGVALPRLLQSLEGAGPWMLLIGLVVHAALESAALGSGPLAILGLAVVLHRVPVGLAVFSLYHEHPRTNGLGWVAIGALILATAAGFFIGPSLLSATSPSVQALLEATVAGMLLHVIWEHGGAASHDDPPEGSHEDHAQDHHGHGAGPDDHDPAPASNGIEVAIAAVLGLVVVVAVTGQGHHHGGAEILHTTLDLTLQTAPALVVAYVLAGLISGLISPRAPAWLSTGGRAGQALKGVAFGLQLPIRSCGVLPMYEALVKRGVPATAALGFLLATPALGIDTLLISLPLLGTELTVVRAVGALLVALIVAGAVGAVVPPTIVSSSQEHGPTPPLVERLREGLRFGLVELVDHTLPWIALGMLAASFASPLLVHPALLGQPAWLQVPLFAAIGVPLYICASGATPLAAVAIYQGISPGAALAFLLTGPAINITTTGVLSQLHGRRTAVAFAAAVGGSAVLLGWGVDRLLPLQISSGLAEHAHGNNPVQLLALAALVLLGLASLIRQGPRGMVGQIVDPIQAR